MGNIIMNKSIIFFSLFLSVSIMAENNEYKREHTLVDTGINIVLYSYPYLVLSMVKEKYPQYFIAKIPNKLAGTLCAALFCAKEWYGRKK